MNTFLKVLLFLAVALLVAHVWPLALLPFLLAAGAILLVGGLAAGGVSIALSVVVSVLGALLAVACTVAVVLSPIWIPVAIVAGIIWLVRRGPAVAA